jgi:hypothetical protein
LWICYLLTKEERKGALKRWFWMIILATCDLYGGESSRFTVCQHSGQLHDVRMSQGSWKSNCSAPRYQYCADTCFTAP